MKSKVFFKENIDIMDTMDFSIEKIKNKDKLFVSDFITENWCSSFIVTKGRIHQASKLSGFICKMNDKIIGLVTYDIKDNQCEIVSLDSKQEHKGLGTSLLEEIVCHAKAKGCNRVWLITTNDNTIAIRFYQKRGFDWIGFYRNAIADSRKLKTEIPEYGIDNIPIKHEIEFEIKL